jgi:hypothetical protein
MVVEIVKKRVAVVGSRSFDDKHRLYDFLTKNRDRIRVIVSGGAKGADSLAVAWAMDYGVPYLIFPAAWHNPDTGEFDRSAGFKRNVEIVRHADVVIAFMQKGGTSGTQHTIDLAKQLGKPVRIIEFELTPPPPI